MPPVYYILPHNAELSGNIVRVVRLQRLVRSDSSAKDNGRSTAAFSLAERGRT